MKLFLALLAAVVAFAIGCDVYDVTETVKGIKAGVAVEGNTFLVSTNKPTAVMLYLRDILIIALSAVPALSLFFLNPTVGFGMLVGPVAAGIKHILGGRAWMKLLAGGALTAAEQTRN